MDASDAPVVIREVGLRDGLYGTGVRLPLALKCDWILLAYAAGLREIEIGTLLSEADSAEAADIAELIAFSLTLPGLVVSVLTRDFASAQRAIAAGVARIGVPVAASDAHSRANLGRGTREMVEELARICAARPAGGAPVIEAEISAALDSAGPHAAPVDAVAALAAELVRAGADCIGVADSYATAQPADLARRIAVIQAAAPGVSLSAHLHDAQGRGLVNLRAALDAGVRRFDATLAGIGGSPLAAEVPGNLCLEEAAALLHDQGFDTGLQLTTLVELRRFVGRHPDAAGLAATIRRAADRLRDIQTTSH
jgi:hydroxymethylglutaryl-CoA lyase